VTSPQGAIIRQIFTDWSGDYSGTTASASVVMDGPKTVATNWRTDSLQLYMIIAVVVIIVAAPILLTIWVRRKKTLAPAAAQETAPPPITLRRCVSCGAEIEPEDAFCIKCGKPA
jgi:hypothetical protein